MNAPPVSTTSLRNGEVAGRRYFNRRRQAQLTWGEIAWLLYRKERGRKVRRQLSAARVQQIHDTALQKLRVEFARLEQQIH